MGNIVLGRRGAHGRGSTETRGDKLTQTRSLMQAMHGQFHTDWCSRGIGGYYVLGEYTRIIIGIHSPTPC